jgi:ATP-dependent protease ClpP protease subunit|tara:strand:- start:387 stop:602 length:216 start_codon:yes stop_codon:yes gene_type:complete
MSTNRIHYKTEIEKMLKKARSVFVYGQISDHEGQYFRISKTAVKQAIKGWDSEEFDLNRFVLRDNQDLYIN